MFARISQKNNLKSIFPEEISQKISEALSAEFTDHCENNDQYFYCFGEIYEDEILTIVSLMDKTDLEKSPKTLFISVEITKDNFDLKIMDQVVNFAMHVFGDVISNPDWNDYVLNWTKSELHTTSAYYKISRENIYLSLEADKILNQNQ